MIRAAMEKHGMAARGWTWKFDNARRRLGQTDYVNRQFSFSIPLIEVNEEAELADTIGHEIAHAIAGSKAGHGRLWKVIALSVGCMPKACGGGNIVSPEMRYHANCPECGKRFDRERLPTARKGHLSRRAGRGARRQRTGKLEPVETYCSPCLDRIGRRSESFERLKLSWVETRTGKAVEWPPKQKAKEQNEAAPTAPPQAPQPQPEPERWTVAPMTHATQPSLF
jgi:predicted SprT family Zn-dependent metalloprotease